MGRTQWVVAVLVLHIALAHSFSWDIVVARSNKLEFYNEGTLAYSAAPASHRIKWIIYDPVRDRVLFADRRNSKMSAATFDIATKITQPLIMKNTKRYFKSFAYDPATELLFGTRVNKIYSFSIKSENKNKVNGDIVIDLNSTVPRELAVESCGGYIYWTASNTIERALFNGSDRKVIIDKGLSIKQGLTIDTKKIYWIESQEHNEGGFSIESADLNGNNRRTLYCEAESDLLPDKLIVSKYFVSWRDSIETAFVWRLPKNPTNDTNVKPYKISITSTSNCSSYGSQDIAANYKIEERTQGVPNCHALKNLLPGYSDCLHAAADGLFCVNGTKVSGESRCECTQGYIGERCDVSVCHNYCYQGDCDVAAGGQPKCRCNAGFSGERCEGNACHDHCYNKGACSLNEEDEPFCQCAAGYVGERCEVSVCKDYCWQGNCSVNAEGQPKCRCDAGYSGERCEVSLCHDYCLNNGTCSLNNHSVPVCNCTGPYEGERCDVPICKDYCFQGECSVSAEGQLKCRCNAGYTGERCHVLICHNYCFQGECTVSAEGQPKCRCDVGYSGERCEVSPCHDYCLNNGICSVNKHSVPVCQCTGKYKGERCEVSQVSNRFHWLRIVNGKLPPNAIIGGFEKEFVYIARANHTTGSLCPGKYVPSRGLGYIPWGRKEHRLSKENVEILCGSHAKWVKTDPSNLPKNAFIGGRAGGTDEVDGDPLYIGRDMIGDKLVVGKVHTRRNKCYLPYYGDEKKISSCEILVEPDDEI